MDHLKQAEELLDHSQRLASADEREQAIARAQAHALIGIGERLSEISAQLGEIRP